MSYNDYFNNEIFVDLGKNTVMLLYLSFQLFLHIIFKKGLNHNFLCISVQVLAD